MNNSPQLGQFSSRFDHAITVWGSAALLAFMRCYVAWQFLKSGWIKVQNWPSTIDLFHNEYHVPLLPPDIAAYMGAGGELAFSCLVMMGLFSRPAAFGLFLVNAMAVISYPQLWEFECPAAINDHFYWGVFLLVVMIFGAGRFSLDGLLKRLIKKTSGEREKHE